MMKDFVHLHLHTEYSLLDGACVIKKMVQKVKELGQSAVAITDHGVMYGCIDFYKECKKAGIKAIIGCEVYVANRSRFDKENKSDYSNHLILLCKNYQGYQNLIKLVSLGYIDGFYNKPRVDKELLVKYSEGLICLSACLAGEIAVEFMNNNYEKAKEIALFYKNTFGAGNYYLEIQDHDIPEQKRILPLYERLSQELDIPLVCTNDCHYINKEDAKAQTVLMCIQTSTTYGDESKVELSTEEFYVKSYDEMETRFARFENAMSNTLVIAEQCNVEIEFGVTKLPRFEIENVSDNIMYFKKLCYKGLVKRYGKSVPQEYVERLDYEINVIETMGYVDYFLIVWDFIRYAKINNIPVGPGRGSGAGSLCAYVIGITGVDPMKYQLIFERFLNPERVTMPDFDIDFCNERRQEIIDYVVRKYKPDHVAQIITFGTMSARAVIRDVGRVLSMPYNDVDIIAKLVPAELNISLDKALQDSSELKKIYDTNKSAYELIEMAKKLEGMPRHASTHAAGIVITREPSFEYIPLQAREGMVTTQFTMTTLEELGLLKIDLLGLRNLTIISCCEAEIKKKDENFSIKKIDFEDETTYKMLSKGQTKGVFQLESAGIRRVLAQLKPTNIEDIVAVLSLYRPGPMDSIPKYIENKNNHKNIEYEIPQLKPILDVTYGCIVYQEQVMQICRELAGYSYGRADLVRRAMSKKKADVMEQERKHFLYGKEGECQGAVAKGIGEKEASKIFDEMSAFASYAFNKSHATAYAYVAYETAYLKCHHTQEFLASVLTSNLGNTDKIVEYVEECNLNNIKVLPPCIQTSELGFTVVGKNISFGLLAVKNLGRNASEYIKQERERNGKYLTFEDFLNRVAGREVNKKAIESLIKCGALDNFSQNRMEMMRAYEELLSFIERGHRRNLDGQIDLFNSGSMQPQEYEWKKLEDFLEKDKLKMEKEILGLFISGHPLDFIKLPQSNQPISQINDIFNKVKDNKLKDGDMVRIIGLQQNKKEVNTKKMEQMAFVQLEDKTSLIELIVFPKIYQQSRLILVNDKPLSVVGKITLKDDEKPKIICENIMDCSNYIQTEKVENKKLYLRFNSQSDKEIEQIINILMENIGESKVFFYFTDTKTKVLFKKNRVNLNNSLLKKLEKVVDITNITTI